MQLPGARSFEYDPQVDQRVPFFEPTFIDQHMNTLGLFAKFWEPGSVKTRLAKDIGPPAAAEIYRSFIEILVNRQGEGVDRRQLAFSPAEAREHFSKLAPSGWNLTEQHGSDLGEKMANFFTDSFLGGSTKVVLIGSDSPNLPPESVVEAFEALDEHRVVLGPTPDGGYYLVGMNQLTIEMFSNIDWSTPRVLSQTRECLNRLNASHKLLTPWFDVDTLDDLRRLAHEISGVDLGTGTRRLNQALMKIDLIA